jgi:sterol 3beta-glucosyltransferase
MKAILFSLGTRGDVEPFLAIALMLKKRNWEVVCGMPEQFRELVASVGLPFYGLSKQFLEVVEGDAAKSVMGQKGSLLKRAPTLIHLYKDSMSMQREVLRQQKDLVDAENPDYILFNGKCFYPFIWGMAHPGKSVFISPVTCMIHPLRHQATVGFQGNYGPFLNKLTYKLSNFFLFRSISSFTKSFRQDFPRLKLNPRTIKKAVMEEEKMFFTVSSTLFPRPDYWPEQVRVMGYHERELSTDWEPPAELLAFLERYPKILFVTFGSMSNPEPEKKTQAILSVLAQHQIPAIINTSWGGLVKPEIYPGHVFFVERIPYDWILPRMYAIMHHGGSGTMHMSMRHGCANLIVPHIFDQFFWQKTLHQLGVGPAGIPIKRLNRARLEPQLLDLMQNEQYKRNAEVIGRQMQQENYEQALVDAIVG